MDFEAGAVELEGAAGGCSVYVGEESGNFGLERVANTGCRLGRGCVAQAWVWTLLHGAEVRLAPERGLLFRMARR